MNMLKNSDTLWFFTTHHVRRENAHILYQLELRKFYSIKNMEMSRKIKKLIYNEFNFFINSR